MTVCPPPAGKPFLTILQDHYMKAFKGLTGRFILLASLVLTAILWIGMAVLYNQFSSQSKQAVRREQEFIEQSQSNKGTLLINMLSRISPEAIMGKDMYALGLYASEVFKDEDIVIVEIFDKNGNVLVEKKKDFDGEPLYFEKKTITDKEKIGIETETGRIRIGLSSRKLKQAKKENAANFRRSSRRMIGVFGVITVLFDVLIAVTLYFVMRKIVIAPILAISKSLRDIAEGEGDLTRRLNVSNEDEIGNLARLFDNFIDQLHSMIGLIVDNSKTLTQASEKLTDSSNSIAGKAEEVRDQSNTVASSTESATGKMNDVSNGATGMSDAVNAVASAIEEMNASLNEVARNCQRESQIAGQADSESKSVQEQMAKLGEAAKAISNVIEVINDIADQTNLLALNATIEAASAGEAGKGFAVVANEVKELARQSALATTQISNQIEEMQKITQTSIDAIISIGDIIQEVNTISQTIVSAVEEQSVTINEISGNVVGASKSASGIADTVQNVAMDLGTVSTNIQGVNSGINETTQGVADIKVHTAELNKLAETLNSIVRKFKI